MYAIRSYYAGAAIPQYKDFTFNVDLPGTRLGRFKLIGLYGDSFIALGHEEEDKEDNSYSGTGTPTDVGSELAVVGLINSYFLNNKKGIRITSYNVCYTKLLRIQNRQLSIF